MYDADRIITVFAPNAMGVDFIRQLRGAGLSVARGLSIAVAHRMKSCCL